MAVAQTFKGILVSNQDGEERSFDFEIGENEEFGQYAKVTSGDQELLVDEDLAYIKGDLPEEWRKPAIDKLLQMLKEGKQSGASLISG